MWLIVYVGKGVVVVLIFKIIIVFFRINFSRFYLVNIGNRIFKGKRKDKCLIKEEKKVEKKMGCL